MAQGSLRSSQEPTNVALYQVGASATPMPRPGELWSGWERPPGSLCPTLITEWETEA